jgi:hypothetical protein
VNPIHDLRMTTLFAPIFGYTTLSERCVGTEYYLAWKRFWDDYWISDFVDLPEINAPRHFEGIDEIMRQSVSVIEHLSKKVDTVAEGRRLLDF